MRNRRRSVAGRDRIYGRTLKDTLRISVTMGVATWIVPVVAPTGTDVGIAEPDELT
ncbi:MAG: hypothetical protein ABSH50_21795 [Bryobacteraceae bacterium]